MRFEYGLVAVLVSWLSTACGGDTVLGTDTTHTQRQPTRTIIMVWDGLRPDSVNATDTPNLYALRQAGVSFNDNHSTYPSFTMMNAASLSTGAFPKLAGSMATRYGHRRRVHLTASPQAIALPQMAPRQPPPRPTTSTRSSPRTTRSCRHLVITTTASYC